jgi:hypothetical protein
MTSILYQIFAALGIEFGKGCLFVVQYFTKCAKKTILNVRHIFLKVWLMRNVFRIFIVWTIVLGVAAFSLPVHAIDYTTKGAPSYKKQKQQEQKQRQDREDSKRCTAADKQYLKTYDRKFRKRIKSYDEIYEEQGLNALKSEDDLDKALRESKRYSKFVNSEAFNKLKSLYKKCGVEQPMPKMLKPFWRVD